MEVLVTKKLDRVLQFFLVHPTTEVHLRELSRNLKISFPWVRKLVNILVKQGLLISRKERGLVIVTANRENQLYLATKRSYNLLSVYKSGLVPFLIEAYRRPEVIVLFGSYAKGEDTERSDIDLAIFTNRKLNPALQPFQKKLERPIRIQEMEKAKITKDFLTTLANGIVLTGYLEI